MGALLSWGVCSFAFIYVGLYGKDFVSAGKDVFKLFKDR